MQTRGLCLLLLIIYMSVAENNVPFSNFKLSKEENSILKDEDIDQTKLQTHSTTVSVPLPEQKNACPSFQENMEGLTQDQFLSILIHSCRYDKIIGPETGGPLNVSVQMDIKHIDATEHQQFRMNMLLNIRYTDYRLKYDHLSPNRRIIIGDESLKNKIWIPHILLINERQSAVMGLEGKDILITINPQGEVIVSFRMNAIIYCWMNLKKFPFDKQKCTLSFRSWTYNASNVLLNWSNSQPVEIANDLHLTQYSLERYLTYSQIVEESSFELLGNYSMVTFEFLISREIGYYMLDYFIPSCLLVAATWGTFWLQADNAPARTTLGTSPMLAFITLAQGQNKSLPKVSYIKAIDIWFIMCALFIFASMAEFFFVNVIWRRKKHVDVKKVNSKYILKSTLTPRFAKKELEMSNFANNRHMDKETVALYTTYLTVKDPGDQSSTPSQSSQPEDDMDNQLSVPIPTIDYEQKKPENTHQWTSMTPQEVAIWIDRRARIAFPCAFLFCNILYWSFVYAF